MRFALAPNAALDDDGGKWSGNEVLGSVRRLKSRRAGGKSWAYLGEEGASYKDLFVRCATFFLARGSGRKKTPFERWRI